jgi:drug/metabolite transporter (DMT)-like permease
MIAPAPDRRRQLRDFILLIIGATVIGNSSVLVRFSEMDPAAIAFWRMMFALPIFVVWASVERAYRTQEPSGSFSMLAWPAAAAGFAFAVDLTTSNIALGLTTMTNFIILVHLAPVMVVIVAWFWFRERPTPQMLIALVLAIAGAALLVQSGKATGSPTRALTGDIFSVIAAFGYAGFILGTRKARLTGGTGLVSLVSCATCAVFCLVFALMLGERIWPHNANAWLMVGLMGVGCHALGQGLSAYAVGTLGASVTSIVLVYGVAVTVAGGWLFFSETPGLLQFAGGVLVLTAVMLCRPK